MRPTLEAPAKHLSHHVPCSLPTAAAALLLTLGLAVASRPAAASEPEKSPTAYGVRVEVTEVKNRIVEGKVRGHTLRVDQPKAFGADDTAPTPPETLAFALGSCVVSAGRLLALQRNLPIQKFSAVVEGELDFAKALGQKTEKRAGFTGLTLAITIDGSLSVEEKKALVAEITALCPMCDNLTNPTPVTIQLAP